MTDEYNLQFNKKDIKPSVWARVLAIYNEIHNFFSFYKLMAQFDYL